SKSVLFGHSDYVPFVAFSPDGARLASSSLDGTVRLWEMALAERGGVLRGHTRGVFDVKFTPDGSNVVSAAWDGTVRFWEASAGRGGCCATPRGWCRPSPSVATANTRRRFFATTRNCTSGMWKPRRTRSPRRCPPACARRCAVLTAHGGHWSPRQVSRARSISG